METKLKLGDKVWRAQGCFSLDDRDSYHVQGPATVTAVIRRADAVTYFLTWENGIEIKGEQEAAPLYLSKEAAQAVSDQKHNDYLERHKRSTSC